MAVLGDAEQTKLEGDRSNRSRGETVHGGVKLTELEGDRSDRSRGEQIGLEGVEERFEAEEDWTELRHIETEVGLKEPRWIVPDRDGPDRGRSGPNRGRSGPNRDRSGPNRGRSGFKGAELGRGGPWGTKEVFASRSTEQKCQI